MPFVQFEKQIRNQLQAMLGKHGFERQTDISAITVNCLWSPREANELLGKGDLHVRRKRDAHTRDGDIDIGADSSG